MEYLQEEQVQPKEMSFVEHLEELRWHLMRAVLAVLVCMTVAFVKMKFIFKEVILGPSRTDFFTYRMMCKLGDMACVESLDFTLQNRQVSGQFTMHIVAALTTGFIVAFPYVFWEIWRFIKPGLKISERKNAGGTVFFVTVLFILGILFGYYLIAPLSINFLANYKLDESILNEFDISSYVGTLCMIVLGGGIMFQLPVVVYILSRVGIMTPQFMRKKRKYAIVVLLIIAALITPSPDVISQMVVALPLYMLYEMSIFISAFVARRKLKETYY